MINTVCIYSALVDSFLLIARAFSFDKKKKITAVMNKVMVLVPVSEKAD